MTSRDRASVAPTRVAEERCIFAANYFSPTLRTRFDAIGRPSMVDTSHPIAHHDRLALPN